MKKIDFIKQIGEVLELENKDITVDTPLHISSLGILSLIVYIDETFDKQFNASLLQEINCIRDLIKLIGVENLE